MKTVIIGGVAAGMSTAARLRRLDENAEIMVLERDHYVSCANCGLTYHIGGEIVEREKLLIVTPDHLRTTLAIDVRTGYDVLAIDRATKEVTVRGRANGRIDRVYTESYDTLVLALGGEPIRPPVPGVDHPRIYTLRTILDMDRIKASVDEGARSAVVIGASYIGVEMVEALRQRGLTVDLVELQHLCLTKRWCRICVTTWSTTASRSTPLLPPEVCRREWGVSMSLTNSNTLRIDLEVMAVGVRPASAPAKDAGPEIDLRGYRQVESHTSPSVPPSTRQETLWK